MAMKWRGGTKSKILRECWTFFNLHFPAPVMEEFALAKLQIFGWCLQFKQSCLWATLSYFCLRKQGRKINAMRRVVFEKCIKKSSALSHVKCEEVSLQIEFTRLPPNTITSLWNRNEKGIGETRKCGHRLIMHSITRRDEMWGGRGREDSGREWVGGSFLPTYIWAGWDGMTIDILFNSIKKGLLLTAIQIRGTLETRRCDADAVRLQVITWNSPLTLCASYLPIPPPSSASYRNPY